ncbi:MAG: hypothetical protein H7Z41_08305 [Cytophagales bacterium]|nr:hypothetical protein [Armatimonadota bacterium]
MEPLALTGLEIAPSQVFGSIRLVPLLRRGGSADLRLSRRAYHEDVAIVALGGDDRSGPSLAYFSYVPHGLVLSWSEDGTAAEAAYGGQIEKQNVFRLDQSGFSTARMLHRMVKREAPRRLRFLPLHMAMEGFLSLFFGGPSIAWGEYSRQALRDGLSPRSERVIFGPSVRGLEDALRLFEIHDRQVGVLIFVAEALASAFVTSDPEDYRALHPTLLEDFYGDLIYQYGQFYDTTVPLSVAIEDKSIHQLSDLRAAADRVRAEWGAFHGFQAGDLIGRPASAQTLYSAGPFRIERFITDLDPARENHIGEMIRRDGTGELMYLKTYRLSAAQTRRVYLLSQLAANEWNLNQTAAALGTDRNGLTLRLSNAGFGYLLHPEILAAAHKSEWIARAGGGEGQ